jgi:hypothetical protein
VGDVDAPREHLPVLLVVGRLERLGEVRALLVDHLDDHAHGLRDDEDVGEDDGRVDEALVPLDGLEGERRGHLGIAAALEEVPRALGFVVLREVSSSCREVLESATTDLGLGLHMFGMAGIP